MNESQRAAAERLIDVLDRNQYDAVTASAMGEAADLLRELLAEPVHESKPTTASQFESVKQAKRAAERERCIDIVAMFGGSVEIEAAIRRAE